MDARWKWALGAAALLGLFLSSPGVRSYWRRKIYLHRLDNKLERLRKENQSLAFELQRLKTDPRMMEEQARRQLGLIQPGEIEYRFVLRQSSGSGK